MRLGVTLTRQWVVSAIQYRRADCDIVLDVISNKGSSVEFGLRLSRPYQRSSVVLAVRNTPGARILAICPALLHHRSLCANACSASDS